MGDQWTKHRFSIFFVEKNEKYLKVIAGPNYYGSELNAVGLNVIERKDPLVLACKEKGWQSDFEEANRYVTW